MAKFATKRSSLVDTLDEIGRFFKQAGKVIVALTVKEIPEEQIAAKLA